MSSRGGTQHLAFTAPHSPGLLHLGVLPGCRHSKTKLEPSYLDLSKQTNQCHQHVTNVCAWSCGVPAIVKFIMTLRRYVSSNSPLHTHGVRKTSAHREQPTSLAGWQRLHKRAMETHNVLLITLNGHEQGQQVFPACQCWVLSASCNHFLGPPETERALKATLANTTAYTAAQQQQQQQPPHLCKLV